jgi:Domain of unknown function (DUF4159)
MNLNEFIARTTRIDAEQSSYRLLDLGSTVAGGEPVYYGLVHSAGQIAVVACHNNDLANFWEWYGSPQYPLRPATDAFRIGANFVVHAMTH